MEGPGAAGILPAIGTRGDNIVKVFRVRLVRALSVAVAAIAIAAFSEVCLKNPHVDDFLSFYTGASALASGHLADLYREQRYAPTPLDLPFIRPPVTALFFEPFTALPFVPAFWLWACIQAIVFLYFLFRAQSVTMKPAAACLFPPVILGIGHGQDCLLFLWVLGASYSLLRRDKNLGGGIVLGLGLLKFHLFLLWPIALILQKRWRTLMGFCLVGVVLVAGSFALVGVAGVMDYLSLLIDPKLTPSTPGVFREVGVASILDNAGISWVPLRIAIDLSLTVTALYALRGRNVEWLFIIVPTLALLVAPHALYYDPTMLLFSLWLVISMPGAQALQAMAFVLASPTVFLSPMMERPWPAASGVALLVFLFVAVRRMARDVSDPCRKPKPVL